MGDEGRRKPCILVRRAGYFFANRYPVSGAAFDFR